MRLIIVTSLGGTDGEVWPGRYWVNLVIDNYDPEGNEAHALLWRIDMHDHELGRLYAELGEVVPGDDYGTSQIFDTFSQAEIETVKAFFANDEDKNVEVHIRPAPKPLKPTEAVVYTGIGPVGDMFCSDFPLEKLSRQLGFTVMCTITHLVTPDNMHLEWDQTLATITADSAENDQERAAKEIAARREQTRRKLQEMIQDDQ